MAKRVTRLYSYFEPSHYNLTLDLDRKNQRFSGSVIIDGNKVGRPTRRLALHQKDLKITSVKLLHTDKKGVHTEIEVVRTVAHRSYDELRLHTGKVLHKGAYTIELTFEAKITPQMHGLYPCDYTLNGKPAQLLATQFESHHAREVFPCIDEPEAKATFALTIIDDPLETAISNMPIKAEKVVKKRKHTTFETSPVMSSYLLAFSTGHLKSVKRKAKNGVEVSVFSTPSHVNSLDFALDTAIRSLEFFEDYFGVAYPLPKLDLLALPDFTSAAMENWGLITFREQALLINPKTSSMNTKQLVALVIAHEMAHQWFGNLVTMRWWNDLWLNESFANMMQHVAVDALFPEWHIWQTFTEREFLHAMNRDATPDVQAIQCDVRHPDEINSLFDTAIVYAKGGSVLNMLRKHIGEQAFKKGLTQYFVTHAYQNTEADDLWHQLSATSSIDVSKFMDPWLTQSGFPLVKVSHNPNQRKVSLHQERFVISSKPSPNHQRWPIPLHASCGISQDIFDRQTSLVTITDNTTAKPLLLNTEATSYFLTHYENEQHRAQLHAAATSRHLSITDRNYLLQCSLLLQKGRYIPLSETLELINAFRDDTNEKIWQTIAGILVDTRRLVYGNKAAEQALKKYCGELVAPLLADLGWDARKNDTAQILALRGLVYQLASYAEVPEVIAEGKERFAKFENVGEIAADIRAVVLGIGVRFGGETAFTKVLKLHNASIIPEERLVLAAALTASKRASDIQKMLQLLRSEHVRPQDIRFWFSWLLAGEHAREACWKWMQENWSWIHEQFAKSHLYDTFPKTAANIFSRHQELHDYEEFFGHKRNEKSLHRVITLGLEEISARVAWREYNRVAIINWFTKT